MPPFDVNQHRRVPDVTIRPAKNGEMRGAVCFGYRTVGGNSKADHAFSRIVPYERHARLVIETFEMYDGDSAGRISSTLNARSAGERGDRLWSSRDLLGSKKRRTGLLREYLYAGILIYQHTERRELRDVGNGMTAVCRIDDLAIVNRGLFERVQERLARKCRKLPLPVQQLLAPHRCLTIA